NFGIDECRKVVFTSYDGSGGAEYYVLMEGQKEHQSCKDEYTYEDEYTKDCCPKDDYDCYPGVPTLLFTPLKEHRVRCGDTTVHIGEKSLISYLSDTPLPCVCDPCLKP